VDLSTIIITPPCRLVGKSDPLLTSGCLVDSLGFLLERHAHHYLRWLPNDPTAGSPFPSITCRAGSLYLFYTKNKEKDAIFNFLL